MKLSLPNQYDFLPRFLRLTIVNVLSNLMEPLASLITVAFLGHLPEIRHLAGIALAGVLFEVIYLSASTLRMATTGVTAQAVGRDDPDEVLLIGLRNGLLALALGILLLMLQYPLGELGFAIVSGTPEVKASGLDYFNARIWGAPAVLINYVVIGWFLGKEENGKVLLLTVVGNGANIVLTYLFIVRWGWESLGAGIAQSASQYLTLLVALILLALQIQWQQLSVVAKKGWNWLALRTTLTLNGNLFIYMTILVFSFFMVGYLGATMGTIILSENSLLLQILGLALFLLEGVEFGTETLTGNFTGKENKEQLVNLIKVSVGVNLLVGLSVALVCLLFPQTVFGLFTNHSEVTEHIEIYARWLLLVLGFAAIAAALEGYFLGLAEGAKLRNLSLVSFAVGFVPVAGMGWYFHNNHLLWLSLVVLFAIRLVIIGVWLPQTFESEAENDEEAPVGVS